jgi:hypothetical protein
MIPLVILVGVVTLVLHCDRRRVGHVLLLGGLLGSEVVNGILKRIAKEPRPPGGPNYCARKACLSVQEAAATTTECPAAIRNGWHFTRHI